AGVRVVLQQDLQGAAAVAPRAAVARGGGRGRDARGAAGVRRAGVEVPDAALEAVQVGGAAAAARIEQGVVVGPVPVDAGVGVRLAAEMLVALDLDRRRQDVDAARRRALVGARA